MNPKEKKFEKSYKNLKNAVKSLKEVTATPVKTKRDVAGVIQHFEFCYELSWKTLKHLLELNGVQGNFPREVLEKAYSVKLIDDPKVWKEMIEDRNLSVHTYDQKLAKPLVRRIIKKYRKVFEALVARIDNARNKKDK